MKKKYVIYKATNKINGKIYIGKTYNFEKRKNEHIYEMNNGLPFHNALKKYGLENFEWEIIDHANTDKDIREKEIYWISKLRTCINFEDCNGYNLTLGGEGGVSWNSKPVSRYDLDGNYIDSFVSCAHASNDLNLDRKSIERAVKLKSAQSGGYQWRYRQEPIQLKIEPYQKPKSTRCIPILQLDLNGNVIARYDSATEASKKLGIGRATITSCLIGQIKRCNGFLWIYEKDYKEEKDYSFKGLKRGLGIVQLNDNFEVLNYFPNCSEAARYLGEPTKVHKQIHKALTSNKRCRGFYWRKVDNINFNM